MISFLEFTMWAIGGSIVLAIALGIISQTVIHLRRDWMIDTRRHERR